MNDLRDVQVEFEAVGRSHTDGRQIGVQPVRLRFAGRPVQDDVGGRNVAHLVSVRIDRVFARVERLDPNALLAFAYEVTVPELVAGHVLAFSTQKRNDDAYMRYRHLKHVDHFDRGESRVDEIAARQEDLLLQSLGAAIV